MPETTSNTGLLKNLFTAILLTGFVAGTLDGTAAIINYSANGGKDPGIIFKYISSAVLGKKALEGGTPIILLGILIHYAVAFTFTLIFFLLLLKTKWLAPNKFAAGLQYGFFVWIVMNMFIVPASHISKETINVAKGRIELFILIVCIGLPVSLMANKHYLYKK